MKIRENKSVSSQVRLRGLWLAGVALTVVSLQGCLGSSGGTSPATDTNTLDAEDGSSMTDASQADANPEDTGAQDVEDRDTENGDAENADVAEPEDADNTNGSNDAAEGDTSEDAEDMAPAECENCGDGDPCNGEESCEDGTCAPGEDLEDGAACETEFIEGGVCIGATCRFSVCGDGIVDEKDELCDDGNTDDGDGCESDCMFTCVEDVDCDDGNACNGEESCSEENICQMGQHLDDGVSCGAAKECRSGLCADAVCGDGILNESTGEACDDGNAINADGCDTDCTLSCTSDSECQNGDVCDGLEICNLTTFTCEAGPALVCDDKDECTSDTCDMATGCVHIFDDADGDGDGPLAACGGDCDDNNAEVYVGQAEMCDGVDNNCDGNLDELAPMWFVDCDGDDYAANTFGAIQSCSAPQAAPPGCPAGAYIAREPVDQASRDCNDATALARPGQTRYFTDPVPVTGGYDYNCDGAESREFAKACHQFNSDATCSNNKPYGYGCWLQSQVAFCGSEGTEPGDNRRRKLLRSPVDSTCVIVEDRVRQSCR